MTRHPVDSSEETDFWMGGHDSNPRGHRAVWIAWVVGVLGFAAAYVGAAVFLGDHVPTSTTVGGVPVGGRTHAAAVKALSRGVDGVGTKPFQVRVGEESFTIDPRKAGLSVDVEGSLEGLTGFSLNPVDLLNHLRGGVTRDLATRVDEGALADAVRSAAEPVTTEASNGTISLEGGRVTVRESVAGVSVDVSETVATIAQQWPSGSPIRATTTEQRATLSNAELQRVREDFAEPAMSGPIRVRADGKTFTVAARALAPAISFTADGETLTPEFDDARLVKAVTQAARKAGVVRAAKDAKVTVEKGDPVVHPSSSGVELRERGLAAQVAAALTSEDRLVRVGLHTVEPKVTTKEAKDALPTGRISTFTTYLPDNPARTENITIAANTLNDTYVAPGETFSLNARLGQRTAAKGYNEAPVIVNGRLTTDYGGGISQLSTTLFNAVFFSGARIDEYLPHSFYISRYPEGREATISWPNVDQKFTNDTGAGILIKARVSGDAVTVSFYGQKRYDIKAVKSDRTNIVEPREIQDDSPDCVPQSPSPGFDVTVTRIFLEDGQEVRRSVFRTHYIPEDHVVCTG